MRGASWQRRVDDLAARHGVPGLQVGLLALLPDGTTDVRTLASGVTSRSTRVEVTSDTLFQWGSITKVWTTTLIMQLIDEGRFDLDTRVVELLPGFTLATPEHAGRVTVRQLLTHTSGIDGDVFTDTGDGDDCVARYVAELRGAVSVTRPGGHHSYCNAGFVVAGRIVEVQRGAAWDDVLAEQLLRPLGLRHTITRAKDAPLFRTAVGHFPPSVGSDEVHPTTTWMLPRSIGPAGLITGAVSDLLHFAALHLRDGVASDGTRLLSARSAQAMRAREVDLTVDSTVLSGWGLGWALGGWGAETAVGHGGGTIGQISDLTLFPDHQLALVVLTNSRTGPALIRDVHELVGDELDLTPATPRVDVDARRYDPAPLVGRWESSMNRWQIESAGEGRLRLTITAKQDVIGEPDPAPQIVELTGPGRFVVRADSTESEVTLVHADGQEHLYSGRLLTKTGT